MIFLSDELKFKHASEVLVKYESIFMDDEPEYEVFDFDTCSMDFIADVVFACETSIVHLI